MYMNLLSDCDSVNIGIKGRLVEGTIARREGVSQYSTTFAIDWS